MLTILFLEPMGNTLLFRNKLVHYTLALFETAGEGFRIQGYIRTCSFPLYSHM